MNKAAWIKLAKTLMMIASVVFLCVAVWASIESLRKEEFTLRPLYLVGAFVFCLLFFFLQSVGWFFALKKLGHNIGPGRASATWFLSQVVKYVPGKVMLPLYRIMYCSRCDVPKTKTMLSIMIELVLMTVSSTLVFAALLPFLSQKLEDRFALHSLILCCVIGLAAIHPKVMNFGVNFALKIFKRDPVHIDFTYGSLLWLLGFFILSWVFYGVSAIFNVMAVAQPWDQSLSFSLAIVAGFAISWTLGFLSFLTPGGIGVREAVLTAILAPFISMSTALAVAVLSRLIWILCEIVGTVATLYWLPRIKDVKRSGT